MKKYTFGILFFLLVQITLGQGLLSELGPIAIRADVRDISTGDEQVKNLLKNRLNQVISKAGIASTDALTPFVLMADIQVTDKAVALNANAVQAIEYTCSFMFCDLLNKKIFSTAEIQIKGVGETEQKAMMQAIKSINGNNTKISVMLERGKERLMEFYNTECETIMEQVEQLKNQGNQLLAFAALANIPEVARECYDRSNEQLGQLYMDVSRNNCIEREAQLKMMLERGEKEKAKELLNLMATSGCIDRLEESLRNQQILTPEEEKKVRDTALKNAEPVHEPEKVREKAMAELKITGELEHNPNMMPIRDQDFLNQRENYPKD
jgi:hypothetical protein